MQKNVFSFAGYAETGNAGEGAEAGRSRVLSATRQPCMSARGNSTERDFMQKRDVSELRIRAKDFVQPVDEYAHFRSQIPAIRIKQ